MDDKERFEQAARDNELRRLEEQMDWEQAERDFGNAPGIVVLMAIAFLVGCLMLAGC